MFNRNESHTEAAVEIVSYFRQQSDRDPDSEEWGLGLEVAVWWQRLLRTECPAPEDVSRLRLVIGVKRREMGPAWQELAGRVEKWRTELAALPTGAPQPVQKEPPEAEDDLDDADELEGTEEQDEEG
jgi:hypothetical protein